MTSPNFDQVAAPREGRRVINGAPTRTPVTASEVSREAALIERVVQLVVEKTARHLRIITGPPTVKRRACDIRRQRHSGLVGVLHKGIRETTQAPKNARTKRRFDAAWMKPRALDIVRETLHECPELGLCSIEVRFCYCSCNLATLHEFRVMLNGLPRCINSP